MSDDAWSESAGAWDRAKRSLGGGVSTSMRATMKPHPLFFSGGSGSHLTDVDGNVYLDYVLGWGPVILGHGHPKITEAVSAQLPLGATYGAGHRLEYEVAERVLQTVPGMKRLLWSNTGSEATQVAIRLARAATGRNRFVKFLGHYHGWSDTMLVGYRPDGDGHFGLGSDGQNPTARDDVDLVQFGDIDLASRVLANRENDISAVILEPVMCNSGVVEPPSGFLQALRDVCDSTGTLLIFDEVITGFRIAHGGAVERYGVTPDMVVLAKAIAGGFPLAAIAGKAGLIDQSAADVVHSGTYNGNPVVLAAAAATLDVLSGEDVYDDLERNGYALAAGIRSSLDRHHVEAVVNQVGSIVQCLPRVSVGGSFDDFLAADQKFYDLLTVEMLRRGLFVLPGGRWYLSTEHTEDDIAYSVHAFDDALVATVGSG